MVEINIQLFLVKHLNTTMRNGDDDVVPVTDLFCGDDDDDDVDDADISVIVCVSHSYNHHQPRSTRNTHDLRLCICAVARLCVGSVSGC